MNEALNIQNDFAATIQPIRESQPPLQLNRNYRATVTRGVIATEFSAVLPTGVYQAVAESQGRIFYLSPIGFSYRKDGVTESHLGGLVQSAEDSNTYFVWYFPYPAPDFTREAVIDGAWIDNVSTGISNIIGRPWVESDLIVTPDAD
jgi:hypothetical protein